MDLLWRRHDTIRSSNRMDYSSAESTATKVVVDYDHRRDEN